MTGIRARTGWLGTVLSTPDPAALATFYAALLGWEVSPGEDPTWRTVRIPGTTHYLGFHLDEAYQRPVWPSRPDRQQMQLHLDIGVADLETAVADALALGAALAETQPQDDVRVLLDPHGHPFCLYLDLD
jgi:catechol 2,3-dioxygenase-like lactoylglutathione lyase family enzyme